jgi:outer membrane protein assembly factor BamD (BamD/ComL family)
MKKKRFVMLAFIIIPLFLISQVPDTSKLSVKDNLLSIKLYNESLELFNKQKHLEAISMLNKAIDLNPDFVKA